MISHRATIGKVKTEIFYHTQDSQYRSSKARYYNQPDAWLGPGYYFWKHIEFAEAWGREAKGRGYKIFETDIDISNCLDTVYNREHSDFWEHSLARAEQEIEKHARKMGRTDYISIAEIYRYFSHQKVLSGMTGILFHDSPTGEKHSRIRIPAGTGSKPFPWKKRVQLCVFYESYDLIVLPLRQVRVAGNNF